MLPDEITRIENEIKSLPLSEDEKASWKAGGKILAAIIVIIAVAWAGNAAFKGSPFGSNSRGDNSYFGR